MSIRVERIIILEIFIQLLPAQLLPAHGMSSKPFGQL